MNKREIIRDIRHTSNINGAALLIYALIMYLSNYAAAFFIIFFSPDESYEAVSGEVNLMMSVVNILAMVAGSFFVKSALKRKRTVLFGFNRPVLPKSEIAVLIVIVLAFAYVSGFVSDLFIGLIESTGVTMTPLESDTSTPFLYVLDIIAMIVLAPLFEELLFRGALTGSVSEYGGFSMALSVGFLFGIWHQNIFQFFYAAALGTALCWLTMKTGSIIPALIVHFIYNFDEVPIMLFDLVDTELADAAYMIFLILVFLIIIAGFILFISTLLTDRERLSIKDHTWGIDAPSEPHKLFAYFTSPLMIIAVLYDVYQTIVNAAGL
jgi:membrane protease YdiL (CAAX protease family)